MARVHVTKEEFEESMEWNSYIVAHWPKWKQEMADRATGRTPVVYPGDE